MISNASDRTLVQNPGTLPQMHGGLLDYFQPLTMIFIEKRIINFQETETESAVTFMGVRQPFTPEMLLLRPEGERHWKWETIHTLPDIQMEIDDVIVFSGVRYRVMQRMDWKEYGYMEYHVAEDFQSAEGGPA